MSADADVLQSDVRSRSFPVPIQRRGRRGRRTLLRFALRSSEQRRANKQEDSTLLRNKRRGRRMKTQNKTGRKFEWERKATSIIGQTIDRHTYST
jgi:hypothetical protein